MFPQSSLDLTARGEVDLKCLSGRLTATPANNVISLRQTCTLLCSDECRPSFIFLVFCYQKTIKANKMHAVNLPDVPYVNY